MSLFIVLTIKFSKNIIVIVRACSDLKKKSYKCSYSPNIYFIAIPIALYYFHNTATFNVSEIGVKIGWNLCIIYAEIVPDLFFFYFSETNHVLHKYTWYFWRNQQICLLQNFYSAAIDHFQHFNLHVDP